MTDRPSRLAASAGILGLGALVVAAAAAAPARATEGVIYSGSAYVDYWGFPDDEAAKASARQVTSGKPGVGPAASLKIGMDINDDLSFSAKLCASCHGVDFEHIALDYQPKTWFNVQFGRIAVPFGDFSNRVDPGSYKTGSQPLIYDMGRMAYGGRSAMNLGVVPLPYVDTGALVYGIRWLGERVQLWYGIYGVAGFRGSNDLDWISMRSVPYNDNNDLPSGGARATLSYASDPGAFIGDWSLGGSWTGGAYDQDSNLKYQAWAADATLRFGKLLLRGEYAARRTDLDPNATYPFALEDPWFDKQGFYAEAEAPLGRYLAAVYRYEELRRTGTPLTGAPADLSTDSTFKRHTAGVVITPASSLFVKLSWELWQTTDFGEFNTYHAGIGGAF